MKFDKLLTHKYKKEIQKFVFDDEPATKIASWVNNTVDGDADIPQDEKIDHYVRENEIREYKKLLKEKAVETVLKIKESSSTATEEVDGRQVEVPLVTAVDFLNGTARTQVTHSDAPMVSKLIEKDVEKNILDVNATLLNVLNNVQSQLEELKITNQVDNDPATQRLILGYWTEIRNTIKDYSKILGVEEYLKEKARNSANKQQNALTLEKKEALRDLLRETLAQAPTETVPMMLKRLDDILGDIDA